MATRCRTCSGFLHDAKGRKSLTGFVYTTLYELALERISPCTSSAVHDFLSQSQSYLCKSCHSTLAKFANIKKNLDEICSTLQSALNAGVSIYNNSQYSLGVPTYAHLQCMGCLFL